MRLLWIRYRCFVHATEDEERVREALLGAMGLQGEARAADRVTRTRAKGHHGNDITVLEGTLKAKSADASLQRLLGQEEIRSSLAGRTERHLDEDGVFHFRLDKQEAVLGRLRPTVGGDAIIVTAKAEAHGTKPEAVWSSLLPA